MTIYSLNVNGLKSALNKGLEKSLKEINADVICLQEIKCQDKIMSLDGYYDYWSFCKKLGFSGTVIFTKNKPINVSYKLDNDFDTEGRIITLEYETFFIITVYTPCSRRNLKRNNYRMMWDELFYEYIKNLENKKPVILCGDFNVDLESNSYKKTEFSEFVSSDKEEFEELLDIGFTDAFKYLYPNTKDNFTWWFVGGKAKKENIGCRIDYFLVSNYLKEKIKDSKILKEVNCSDHCPITLDIDLYE